jgi:uncharacterized protein (DUF433 family)
MPKTKASAKAHGTRGRGTGKATAPAAGLEGVPFETTGDGTRRFPGSRIPIDTVISAFEDGATAEAIAQQYPTLALADIYQFLGYYLKHRDETEVYLAERRVRAAQVRAENESRWNPAGIRKRLRSRLRRAK